MLCIHAVNLAALDLNLLVVLEALLEERSVTAAGKRVGLSQPATSNALGRLRALLGDRLLVRRGRALFLTPRGEQLRRDVRPALDRLRAALARRPAFDPAALCDELRVGMNDYAAYVLLPRLVRRLRARAPRARLAVLAFETRDAARALDAGEVHVGLAVEGPGLTGLESRPLLRDEFALVCRPPAPRTLRSFLARPHLLVSPHGGRVGVVDRALAAQQLERDVHVTLPHFLMAPHLLSGTDLVGVLAGEVARDIAPALKLVVTRPPLALPGFTLSAVWHPRLTDDPAHAWLREQLAEAAAEQQASRRASSPARRSRDA
ncbi:LysR family transcriptional regulator [Sorangium sp. So ce861]|uniref:LysR family transcriptional regulator n=1 Tax=Sorangium sp. So ce861 TaxID=3133323 RepID=UPI003F606F2D